MIKMNIFSLVFSFFIQYVMCRDFYIGMFKPNDYLVAQDIVYKEASPFGYTTASYGRLFKCPITFFRVVDRLGLGRGPYTSVVRGGLLKKYITVRMRSPYRLPISVNIYVGCESKIPRTVTFPKTKATTTATIQSISTPESTAAAESETTTAEDSQSVTTSTEAEVTTTEEAEVVTTTTEDPNNAGS